MKLTLDGYWAMGELRLAFDDWMRDEGLTEQLIFAAEFGEGHLLADCWVRTSEGTILCFEGRPVPTTREFRLTTPPPRFVSSFCEQVTRP